MFGALVVVSLFWIGVMGCWWRRSLVEQHRVHELCEDAAYAAGLERGRSEKGMDLSDAWYKKGFNDAQAHAAAVERKRHRRVCKQGTGAS
jgi:hypothetical protein